MKTTKYILFFIALIIFARVNGTGSPHDIRLVFIKNGDTTLVPNNAFLKLCYAKDSIYLPIQNERFTFTDSIDLNFSNISLLLKNQEIRISMTDNETFEHVFDFEIPDGTMTIQYFDNYKIAKSNYGKYININESDFKSATIFSYQWYNSDIFIINNK